MSAGRLFATHLGIKSLRFLAAHPRALFVFTLLYLISPLDLAPEALLGPFGMVDDVLVLLLLMLTYGKTRTLKTEKKASPYKKDYYDTTAR